jgi:hypothetical protein
MSHKFMTVRASSLREGDILTHPSMHGRTVIAVNRRVGRVRIGLQNGDTIQHFDLDPYDSVDIAR